MKKILKIDEKKQILKLQQEIIQKDMIIQTFKSNALTKSALTNSKGAQVDEDVVLALKENIVLSNKLMSRISLDDQGDHASLPLIKVAGSGATTPSKPDSTGSGDSKKVKPIQVSSINDAIKTAPTKSSSSRQGGRTRRDSEPEKRSLISADGQSGRASPSPKPRSSNGDKKGDEEHSLSAVYF